MAPLTRGLDLLESAVSYGLAVGELVTPQLLAHLQLLAHPHLPR
jgi:hypothetical protein